MVKVDGRSFKLDVVEDFTQDAIENLHMDIKSTYLRSFYRGLMKMKAAIEVATKTSSEAKKATSNISNPLLKVLANTGIDIAINKAINEVNESEKADTRMGNYLPDQASIGGITLDPGTYQVEVVYEFKDYGSYSRNFTVEIKEGKNTIITSSCAR